MDVTINDESYNKSTEFFNTPRQYRKFFKNQIGNMSVNWPHRCIGIWLMNIVYAYRQALTDILLINIGSEKELSMSGKLVLD